MKKIFTLLAATFITLVTFADNRPRVTIRATKNYEIVIDGKSYFTNHGNVYNIPNLYSGKHTVRVFEVNRYMFRTTRRLVSSSSFRLNKKDVAITVDQRGNLRITESKYGKDFDRNDRRDNDWGHDRDDRDGRGRGRGF